MWLLEIQMGEALIIQNASILCTAQLKLCLALGLMPTFESSSSTAVLLGRAVVRALTSYQFDCMCVGCVVGSRPCSGGTSPGYPPSTNTNTFKFQFDQEQWIKSCSVEVLLQTPIYYFFFVETGVWCRQRGFSWAPKVICITTLSDWLEILCPFVMQSKLKLKLFMACWHTHFPFFALPCFMYLLALRVLSSDCTSILDCLCLFSVIGY